jgi:uncharacterized membrane protein YccC
MTLRKKLGNFIEREAHQPDHGRAWRCTIAFMAPLLLALTGRLPVEVTFGAIAAQSIALVDVRGAYALRLTLLLAMTAILAGAAGFGALMAHPLAAALLATVIVAACTGLWRHLSSDYGPSIAVSSSLLFFIALNLHGGSSAAGHHMVATLLGGLWGVVLQVALWPISAQHPLRRAVSDAWLAAADLFSAISPAEPASAAARHQRVAERETDLRVALDKAYAVLDAPSPPSPFTSRLAQLNLACARLAMRVTALATVLETLTAEPAVSGLEPALQPVLAALANTARTVALAVVSRQPSHFSTAEVRLRRLTSLLGALQARVIAQTGGSPSGAQLTEILRQIEVYLPTVGEALRATIDRAGERAAFSLELFDLQTLKLRPLAAALNLSTHVDKALARFTVRISVLTLIGVAIIKAHPLPHSYWLPFTLVVVLQPDYGSTRRRAAQRLLGTLAGSILASLMLWLHPPFAALMAVTASMSFLFGFFVRRNYGVAVIFVTLFIVLLTEANGPVTLALTLERLGTTTAGGLLALLAAQVFWPVWERELFPPILARTLRANRDYLVLIVNRLESGGAYDPEIIAAKRRAETANSVAFSSLQRMAGDPKNRQDRLQQAAALANGAQRLTRVVNLLALHLEPGMSLPQSELGEFSRRAATALETLAFAVENPAADQGRLDRARSALDELLLPAPDAGVPRVSWVFNQLARAGTELSAMLLAVRET